MMYEKFWNQFLLEQNPLAGATVRDAEATFAFDDEPTKPDPPPERRALTGLTLFLSEKGYYLDKMLGSVWTARSIKQQIKRLVRL